MKTFTLTPVDAWFFRDGRPYNEKEANQADATSLFPPPARTLSGALRAALARANGWSGSGPWSLELNAAFGANAEDLAALQFSGPFLTKNQTAYWPLPRHLLGCSIDKKWNVQAFLHPAESLSHCDAGETNLPVIALPSGVKRAGLKPAETAWISTPGLTLVLAGKLPKAGEIIPANDLWAHEPRVGLRRHEEKRTTEEGALYSPAYVRLCRGVSLGFGISGVPVGRHHVDGVLPFGGESRLAHCEAWPGSPLPTAPPLASFKPQADGLLAFTVTLLTPGCFKAPPLPGATVVSACVGKPVTIGGWDSLKRIPLPLEPFAPAGSVWFCTAAVADFAAIHAMHGTHFGKHAAHGFGQIVIGLWPSK